MIKNLITDGYGTGNTAKVTNDPDEPNALVVTTRPEKTFSNSFQFFSSDEYGSNMNINTGASGTPDKVHNGTDDILWTASNIVGGGKFTFDSADQNHTPGGALSIKVNNAPAGDVFQIAKGSDINLNNYASITLWIYVDNNWDNSEVISLYAWDTDTNSQVGDSIDLKDYFDNLDNDVWQKVKISLVDMNIQTSITVDALRVDIEAKSGQGATFYMDDIQFEELGDPEEYYIKPDKGTWLHSEEFTVSVAAVYPGTLTDATVPYIAYDDILGTSLAIGLVYQREQNGVVLWSLPFKGTLDFMQIPGADMTGTGSDGTNMWYTISITTSEPIILKAEDDDILRFIVNDDLSDLLRLRISSGGKIEQRCCI